MLQEWLLTGAAAAEASVTTQVARQLRESPRDACSRAIRPQVNPCH